MARIHWIHFFSGTSNSSSNHIRTVTTMATIPAAAAPFWTSVVVVAYYLLTMQTIRMAAAASIIMFTRVARASIHCWQPIPICWTTAFWWTNHSHSPSSYWPNLSSSSSSSLATTLLVRKGSRRRPSWYRWTLSEVSSSRRRARDSIVCLLKELPFTNKRIDKQRTSETRVPLVTQNQQINQIKLIGKLVIDFHVRQKYVWCSQSEFSKHRVACSFEFDSIGVCIIDRHINNWLLTYHLDSSARCSGSVSLSEWAACRDCLMNTNELVGPKSQIQFWLKLFARKLSLSF